MSKMRVYEIAKKHNMQSKELIQIIKDLGLAVSNHMSVLEEDSIVKIENKLKSKQVAKNNQEKKPNVNNKEVTSVSNDNQKTNEGSNSVKNNSKIEVSDDINVDTESVGKTKKKTKPNNKRFDDNKISTQKNSDNKITANNKKRNVQEDRYNQNSTSEKGSSKNVIYTGSLTVGELAKQLGKEPSEIIKKLLFLGVMATINQELELDAIQLISEEYGVTVEEKIEIDEDQFELFDDSDEEQDLQERSPVVTIMGHVDHGKTTLLDAFRNSRVVSGEAGGITQHIGAYQAIVNDKRITFLDTPGHAAFTTMRARGAQVTDITILVVAADDGVMPQTVEAINHAKAANVPIIVAVNKMDREEANSERVKQELTEHGLIPEDWGGDTIFVPVSALKHEGLEELLEMILLVAEVQELKANPDRLAKGTIIESQLDKGKGAVATVLVQNGTLRVGDPIVAGTAYGKVRAMVNDRGKRIKEAGPSTPVEITGLNEVPHAGDPFIVFEEERKARVIGEKRANKLRESELNSTARVTLDDLYKQIQEGEIKELNVIIKADVQGSVEALHGSLEKIDVEGVRVKIIHKGVGAITETDVTLASASNAIIIGFNVRPEPQARASAEREKVDVRLHRIIYNVIDEIKAALQGMLDPEYQEVVTGRAEIRQVFKASNIGTIAGSYVIEGKVTRNGSARVIRDGIVIFEGDIDSIKRFKDDVKEVQQGYECGITIKNFSDIKEGDFVESFVMEVVKK